MEIYPQCHTLQLYKKDYVMSNHEYSHTTLHIWTKTTYQILTQKRRERFKASLPSWDSNLVHQIMNHTFMNGLRPILNGKYHTLKFEFSLVSKPFVSFKWTQSHWTEDLENQPKEKKLFPNYATFGKKHNYITPHYTKSWNLFSDKIIITITFKILLF